MNTMMDSTLSQIVNDNLSASLILERFRLDYCCKGRRTLRTACAEQGLDPMAVVTAIRETKPEAGGPDSWSSGDTDRSLSELCDHIEETHHGYVKRTVPAISAMLEKIANKHGTRHPELKLIREEFWQLSQDLLSHLRKEEQVLFPAIRWAENKRLEGRPASVGEWLAIMEPIQAMEAEHRLAGDQLELIRELTHDYTAPGDACNSYKLSFQALAEFELDLHQHVHLENNILFPAVGVLAGLA